MAGGFKRIEDYDVVDPVDLPDDAVVYTVLPSESTPALIDRNWTWVAFKAWLTTFTEMVANALHRASDGSDHGFIDQDVKSSASPTYPSIIINSHEFKSTPIIVAPTGNKLTISGISSPKIATLDSTHIAFIDAAIDQLRHYAWDGTNWTLDGAGLNLSGINRPSIAALDSTHVVVMDNVSDTLRTYVWGGSAWTLVGNALDVAPTGVSTIAILDSTHVALLGSTSNKLVTYVWNGIDWATVGNSLSISVNSPAIATLNATHVVVADILEASIATYAWDEIDWTLEGEKYPITFLAVEIAGIDSEHILLADSSRNVIHSFAWNGSYWSKIDLPFSLPANDNNIGLTALDSINLVYIDQDNKLLSTYKIGYLLFR